jgi:hypothetical protein
LQNVWNDGATQFRSGSSLTTNAGSTTTLGGVVNLAGNATLGPTPVNDLSEAIAPSSLNLAAWNYPYYLATGVGSAVTTAGALYLGKTPLAGGTVVTNLWIKIATGAVTPTTGQNFAGIYSSTGALVATTADLTTAIGTNTGAIQCPLTAAFTVPAGGANYWFGVFFNASTQPVLSTITGTGLNTVTTGVATMGSATTFGNTAAKYPFAVSATGSNTTALPASITMASNTATGAYNLWFGAN